jgi:hypothetical protein
MLLMMVMVQAFRAFMYRQEELAKDDAAIYHWCAQQIARSSSSLAL